MNNGISITGNRGGNKKSYTEADDKIIAEMYEDATTKEIATRLGRSQASITYRIGALKRFAEEAAAREAEAALKASAQE